MTTQTRSVIGRLARALGVANGFSLFVCQYSARDQRDAALALLPGPTRTFTMGPQTPDSTYALLNTLRHTAGGKAIHLLDLDRWPTGFEDLMIRLQYQRNSLPETCPQPVVMWLTHEQADWMPNNVGDLWAWRMAYIDLDDDPTLGDPAKRHERAGDTVDRYPNRAETRNAAPRKTSRKSSRNPRPGNEPGW